MQSNICPQNTSIFNKTYSTDQKLADRFRSNFQNMMHSCEGRFHRGKIWVFQHKQLSHMPKNLKNYGVSQHNFVSQSRLVPLLWSTGNVQPDRSQKLSKGYAPHTYKHTHIHTCAHTRMCARAHARTHAFIWIIFVSYYTAVNFSKWNVKSQKPTNRHLDSSNVFFKFAPNFSQSARTGD